MSLTIAGRVVSHRDSLTQLCHLTLSLIAGGVRWLDWTIDNPAVRHEFPDETELVVQVQQQLHASDLTLLPRLQLMISPIKLMTLGVADLRTMAKAETGNGDAVIDAMVSRVLASHGLVTRDALAAGGNFLVELGVASAPLFQAPDVSDSLAIHELIRTPQQQGESQPSLKKEAASFAVSQASTPREFCDYYLMYLDLAATLPDFPPEERRRRAQNVVETLSPLVLCVLDHPQLNGLAGPGEVMSAVREWHGRGKLVGFDGLSRAVQQVVRHSTFREETGAEARHIVRRYLDEAQTFLAASRRCAIRMGQDATCFFRVESDTEYAEMKLESSGVLSLREFGPKPAPPSGGAESN